MTPSSFPDYSSWLFAGLAFVAGSAACWGYQQLRLINYRQLGSQILAQAQQEAQLLRQKADLDNQRVLLDLQRNGEEEQRIVQRKLQREQERLEEREDKLEARMLLLDKKLGLLDSKEELLHQLKEQLQARSDKVMVDEAKLLQQWESTALCSREDAYQLILKRVEGELQGEIAQRAHRAQAEMREQADQLAKSILTTAIGRLAVSCASEGTMTTVTIPNDEMKSRIIGREGRNIRHLERLTGVNFLIDDTPGVVVISGFDSMRKQIAKMALTDLLKDGRIHPTRIDEAVEKAQRDLEQQVRRYGDDAARRVGVGGLHSDIVYALGKLNFRTSYAQNVLEHSVEVAHLMGLMAAELGLDIALAKRIGLLHDMGKALSHEIEGSHAVVGHDLALRCGEPADVANGIGCHHGEMVPTTLEGSLCGIADSLSAARPGARVEAIEDYLQRLKQLEAICCRFPGVERAYALQAGREVHVSILPDVLDDAGTLVLSRDIARAVEKELSYPGKIKVTAIREKRCVQYAL